MAVADGINPSFLGRVTSRGQKLFGTGSAVNTISVLTNGTTQVPVFGVGLTTGFAGSVVAIKAISMDSTAGEISVYSGFPTETRVEVARVKKAATGTATNDGAVVGSAVTTGQFIADGTLVVVSSSAGNALVDITFIAT